MNKLFEIGGNQITGDLTNKLIASFVGELLAMFFSPVKSTGSADLVPEVQAVY